MVEYLQIVKLIWNGPNRQCNHLLQDKAGKSGNQWDKAILNGFTQNTSRKVFLFESVLSLKWLNSFGALPPCPDL